MGRQLGLVALLGLAVMLLAVSPALVLAQDEGDWTLVYFIQRNTTWRYDDGNRWPGNSWMTANYDDSSWKAGRAYFATPEETAGGGFTTELAGGNPAYRMYFFRTKFSVPDASKVLNMSLRIDYDDAYVVYLNGRAVASSNFACNWSQYESFCLPLHNSLIDKNGPNDPRFPEKRLLPLHLGYLVNGTNYLAVAVKQANNQSSDAAFMMELYGGVAGGEPSIAAWFRRLKSSVDGWLMTIVFGIIALAGVFLLRSGMNRRIAKLEKTSAEISVPIPAPESVQDFTFVMGRSYLFLEDTERAWLDVFFKNVAKGDYAGLCITRNHPDDIKKEFNPGEKVKIVWLTDKSGEPGSVVYPTPLEISMLVGNYAQENKNAIIVLDGLQYLINKNGFSVMLKLLWKLKDDMAQADAVLIIPVIRMSLEEKELGLLETELEVFPRKVPRGGRMAVSASSSPAQHPEMSLEAMFNNLKGNLSGLNETSIALVSMESRQHADTVTSLMKLLVNERGMNCLYISASDTYDQAIMAFTKAGVKVERIFFIDCISRMAGKVVDKGKNSVFIENPTSLEEVTIYVDKILTNIQQPKVIVLDSISSLRIYSNDRTVEKFAHTIINKIRLEKIAGVIVSIKQKEVESLARTLVPMCDLEVVL
ncbi:MAG: DUF835 domain-containing protein [Candidatus Altiarchaeota archaeon]|nr:DUF835 domain-containing protein [Candidatus Altiarchaeota archaeon]